MAITLVHSAAGTGTSITITSTTAGNCLVVCFGTGANGGSAPTVTGVTLGGAAGNFASLISKATATAAAGVFIWADPNCAGGQTAIAVSGTNLANSVIWVYEFSGVAASSILDVSASAAPAFGTASPVAWSSGATATTAQAVEAWVGVCFGFGTGADTVSAMSGPASPWANLTQEPGGLPSGAPQGISGSQITSSTGAATYSGSTTHSNVANSWGYAAAVVTLKPNPATTTSGGVSMSGTMAMSGSALGGNTTTSGGVVMAPAMHTAGTDIETFAATGGMNMTLGQKLAMAGTIVQGFPFPQVILAQKIELLINGTWTDISTYVQQRAVITITRSKLDETSSITSSTLTLTLNNRDGRFSPKNSSGAYYPFIGRNTQIRASVQSGVIAAAYIYRFWGETSEWPPQWEKSQTDVWVSITASGILRRYQQSASLGSALTRYWTQLGGAGAPIAYWACEDDSSATSLASGLPGGSAMTFTGTPALASDTKFGGTDPIPQLNGSVWTGSAPSFASGPFTNTTPGDYTWTCPQGITTIQVECTGGGGPGLTSGVFPSGVNGGPGAEYAKEATLAVTPGNSYPYHVGAGGSPGVDGEDSFFTGDAVTVRAHGGKAAGTVGTGSVNTTHHDGGPGGPGSSGIGGSGGGGGGGGGSGGSAATGNTGGASGTNSPGAAATAVTGGGPGGAGGYRSAGFLPVSGPGGGGGGGNAPAVGVGNGGNGYAGQVKSTFSTGTVPGANVLRFLLDIPAAGGVNGAIVGQLNTAGTIAKMNVVYHTGGNLELIGLASGGGTLFDSGSQAFGANGTPMVVSAELTPSGANLAWKLTAQAPGAGSPIATFTGTVVTASLGSASSVVINSAGTDTGATGLGAIAVQYAVTSLTDVASAASGHSGERAATRFTRLCTEMGITSSLVGNAADTPQMGAQVNDKLVSLLQGIEDFDRGHLFEPRGFFGLTYRTRVSMQNQSPVVAFNYTAAQLAAELLPVVDDQLSRNDVTVTRAGGSSARQFLATGAMSVLNPPNGIGEYTYPLTVAAFADTQLANLATWIMDVGTVDEYRYPVVTIDLARSQVASLFATTLSMDVGDYFQVTNAPTFVASGTAKQLAWGFTEIFGPYGIFVVAINGVPESVYEGGGLPTW